MASTTKIPKESKREFATRTLSADLPAPPSERWDELPELDLYLFDERKRFLMNTPFDRGTSKLDIDLGHARLLRAVVAPRGLSPESVGKSKVLPCIAMDTADVEEIEFPYGWWEKVVFGLSVNYHGRVEKVIGESTLPIREGIVEVYEVDPWVWIVELPELEILRFRDDLLRVIDPARIPEEVQPIPEPWPPGPDPFVAKGLINKAFAENAPMEIPPMAAPAWGMNVAAMAKPRADVSAAAMALQPSVLEKLTGNTLRSYLLAKKELLTPLLCLLVPDWWYRKDKLGEVPIQPDGTFSGTAGWWLPGLDRQDLYFRVRQVIDGTDTTIYNPPVSCNTYWDYAGEEVVLRVTHPDAVAVEDSLVAENDQVVFLGVGFDKTTDVVTEPGLQQTGTDIGVFKLASGKVAPYARKLHIVLDVDLYGLVDAGVEFYRMSYRRGHQLAVGDPTDWTYLTTPINRHYREVNVVGGTTVVSYPVVSMVPTPAEIPVALAGAEGLFKFADPVRDYVVINRADRAFGIWDTEDLPGPGQDHGDVADVYTVRLELFDGTGNDITATTPILRIHTHEPDDTYTTTALAPTQPFLYVHVDNRPMVAEIRDQITAGTSSTGTGCGFLVAGVGEDVDVDIRAHHPAGVGYLADPDRFISHWNYKVTRGAAATPRVDATVDTSNVGSPATWHSIPDGDIPLQTVSHLLAGVPQRRCTFNVRLEAHTLTRNGYGRLDYLDRADNAAFALLTR